MADPHLRQSPSFSIPPRLLTRAQLRAYLGDIAAAELDERIRRGRLPGPLWGATPGDKAARWDRRAVDMALDRASAIPGSLEADTLILDRSLGLA